MLRIFFDIETTPNIVYSWRTGGKISISPNNIIEERKIICLSYKWGHKKKVYTLKWDANQDDKQLIVDFVKEIEEADQLIGHNGDNFDIKWLRTRAIYHGVYFPESIETLDTLKKARKGFKFNSNKLDYIGKFLNVGKKQDTGGFDLWVKVMNGDKEALNKMISYCENDVVLLQKVYEKLEKYIEHNTHLGVYYGLERYSCPRCASQNASFNGQRISKTGVVKFRLRCNPCDKTWSISGAVYRKFLEFKYNEKQKRRKIQNDKRGNKKT